MNSEKLLDEYCKKHQSLKSWKKQRSRDNFDEMANHFSYWDMEQLAKLAILYHDKKRIALKIADFVKEIDLAKRKEHSDDKVRK